MKTKIKASITVYKQNLNAGLLQQHKKKLLYNFYFRKTAILFLYFLPFPFTLFFSFPYLFRFNFVISERNVHIPFCRHTWAELSLLSWRFLSGTFFPGGGGGCTCTQCTAPSVRACVSQYGISVVLSQVNRM